MALIDKLREVADFPASHQPATSELLELVGVLIAYAEHGDDLLTAAADDVKAREAGEPASHVNDLLSPSPPAADQDVTPPAAPSPASPAEPDERDAEIASLRQQLATAQAQQGRTVAGTDPDAPPPDAPPPAGPVL